MAERGFDLAELWQRERYRFTFNLIRHLPRNSHYMQARMNDDELIEAEVREHGMPERPARADIPLTKFDPTVEALAAVHDRLGEVVAAIAASAGSKRRPKMPAYPRPKTGYDRVEAKITDNQFLTIVEKLAPHDYDRVARLIAS